MDTAAPAPLTPEQQAAMRPPTAAGAELVREGTPGLAEILAGLEEELGRFVRLHALDGHSLMALTDDDDPEGEYDYAGTASALHCLTGAIQNLDVVIDHRRSRAGAFAGPDPEQLVAQVWQATQEAGLSTEQGDKVCDQLRARFPF